jgi:steroid delta-isomerase-like uncharacterized protein
LHRRSSEESDDASTKRVGKENRVSEENKRVQRRVIEEVFNRGDLDLVDELFSQNHVQHDPSGPQVGQGTEEFKGTVSAIRAAFPDLHMQIEDHIAEGDRVVTRWVGSDTHRGDFMGVPPTGNRVSMTGTVIDRFADGKIEESWNLYDALGMLTQMEAK